LCIAAAILLVIALVARERAIAPTKAQRVLLVAAGVVLAVHFATWIASLDYTTVAISTLLVSTSPLFTTLYDAIVRRRRFPITVPVAFIEFTGASSWSCDVGRGARAGRRCRICRVSAVRARGARRP
jgi:drug/metabolite transporter (DMT)-like permease